MRRDPTEFRKRFAAYKDGKQVYNAGKPIELLEVIITPDSEYNQYLNTLPDNQKYTPESEYRQHRYWELNDKPKNFSEAIGKGMFSFEGDGLWHSSSVSYNKNNDTYEFMKSNNHPSRWMEDVFGGGSDIGFMKDWQLEKNPMFDRYTRRNKINLGINIKPATLGLPKYEIGTPPNEEIDANEYDAAIKMLSRYEGFRDKVYLDGNGIKTIGYGFTDPKYVNMGTMSRSQADEILIKELLLRDKFLLTLKNWDKLANISRTALRSYYYNYPAGFGPDTKFIKYWNAEDYSKAIREMDAGMNDEKNPGLRKRRLEEQHMMRLDPLLNPIAKIKPVSNQVQTPVLVPVSTRVSKTIPQEQTVPALDPTVSPYISGLPVNNIISIFNKQEQSRKDLLKLLDFDYAPQWQPLLTYKNGKLPRYIGGTIPLITDDENNVKIDVNKGYTAPIEKGMSGYDPFLGAVVSYIAGKRGGALLTEHITEKRLGQAKEVYKRIRDNCNSGNRAYDMREADRFARNPVYYEHNNNPIEFLLNIFVDPILNKYGQLQKHSIIGPLLP